MDTKLDTFLQVVRLGSYTKAGKELHITQPAVTQHMKSLEEYFGSPLLYYKNRGLELTKEGNIILQYAKNLEAMETMVFQRLGEIQKGQKVMRFASTLTIGEFTMEPIMERLMGRFRDHKISMRVDNTQRILAKLKEGELSFALIEGLFKGGDFDMRKLKDCPFILVVSKDHWLAKKEGVHIGDLLGERIIVREKGSGSREILEMGLREQNQSLDSFMEVMELGNVNLMKSMVEKGLGISFMYTDAALKEIKSGALVEVPVEDLNMTRGFYFVSLNNGQLNEDKDRIYNFLKMEMGDGGE